MLMRALYDLAVDEGLSPSYEPLAVHYLIHLGAGGKYLGYTAPVAEQPVEPKGRSREPRPVKRLVPRRSSRTSGVEAEFLVDKAEYVFGVDPTSSRKKAALKKRHDAFQAAIDKAAKALPDNAGLRAVKKFLSHETPDEIKKLLRPKRETDRQRMVSSWFGFIYEPDGGATCVHDHSDVQALYERHIATSNVGDEGQCLVTGKRGPLTRLHPAPKGIPPVSITKGGVPLTATNQRAFVRYGLDKIGGAPIGTKVGFLVDAALSRLLDDAYLRPSGEPLPRRCVRLSADTVFAFWSRGGAELDFIAALDAGDPEQVAHLLRSPHAGRASAIDDPSVFYGLVLSGAQGRGIVRSVFGSTVSEVARSMERHFTDAAVVRPFGDVVGTYSLKYLRVAIAPLVDVDRLPPNVAQQLYWSTLLRRPYPRVVLDLALRRNRVESLGETSDAVKRFAARCSLIKAYLSRARMGDRKEIAVSLDTGRTDVPYLLGRLVAVLDKTQQDALGDVGVTVADQFFGRAASTPAAVVPMLLQKAQHHLGKLRRDNHGLYVVRDRLIQGVISGLDRFPRTLSLEDQGLFTIGFHHQRQDFFRSKEQSVETE